MPSCAETLQPTHWRKLQAQQGCVKEMDSTGPGESCARLEKMETMVYELSHSGTGAWRIKTTGNTHYHNHAFAWHWI